jgi:hypothetical protein
MVEQLRRNSAEQVSGRHYWQGNLSSTHVQKSALLQTMWTFP